MERVRAKSASRFAVTWSSLNMPMMLAHASREQVVEVEHMLLANVGASKCCVPQPEMVCEEAT